VWQCSMGGLEIMLGQGKKGSIHQEGVTRFRPLKREQVPDALRF
jgi:hypothetical protein